MLVDISYAAPQVHGIVNIALYHDCFSQRLQAMVTTRWLLPRVNTRMSKKLSWVKLKLAPHKKTPKLTLLLKELRCEGVEFIALEHVFL
jgi:hypothetical protein